MAKSATQGKMSTAAEMKRLVALFNAGELAEMESRARLWLERDPVSGQVWKALGIALHAQGKEALPALRRAAELLPQDAEAQDNLGRALHAVGEFDSAVASFTCPPTPAACWRWTGAPTTWAALVRKRSAPGWPICARLPTGRGLGTTPGGG